MNDSTPRILITGSTGFVGWNSVRYFADCGLYVQPTFHLIPHYLHTHLSERLFEPVAINVLDRSAIDEVVSRFQPTFLFHTAAASRPSPTTAAETYQSINVQGTSNVAAVAAQHGVRLIHLSSDAIYGADVAHALTESFEPDPDSLGLYARSKWMGEVAVRSSGADWTILRPTVIYGDGNPHTSSFTQQLDRSWDRGEAPRLFRNQFRRFLYINDALSAVRMVMEHEQCNLMTYNIAGRETLSRFEFGTTYANATGRQHAPIISLDVEEAPETGALAGYLTPGTEGLEQLGWKARPLTECFRDMERSRNNFAN